MGRRLARVRHRGRVRVRVSQRSEESVRRNGLRRLLPQDVLREPHLGGVVGRREGLTEGGKVGVRLGVTEGLRLGIVLGS